MLRILTALAFTGVLVFPQSQMDQRQRVRTVRELGKGGEDRIPAIAEYVKDPDLEVRLEAVKALDGIGGPKSVDPLVRATRDNDPEVQIRATDGLVNAYLPGYIKVGIGGTLKRAEGAVKGKFTDTNDQIIDAFVEVPPEVIQAMGRLVLSGATVESRSNAARAAGILRGQGAVKDLLEALSSKDDQVMYESLVALQKIRDPASGPKLAFMVNDLRDEVQIAAIQAVGVLRTHEAAPDLRAVLAHARNQRAKREALESLAMISDPSDHNTFVQFMGDRDNALRAAGAEGLGRLKNPMDLSFLETAFKMERATDARLSIAFALAALGQIEVREFSPLPYLVTQLNSKSYRGVALALLIELLRDVHTRQAVYPLLATATRDEKTGLGTILGRSGDKDSESYLETLQSDPDRQVAEEGVRSLRALRARLR